MDIKIRRIHPQAKLPEYAYPGDAGMDLFAPERAVVPPNGRVIIGIGFAFEIPEGHAGVVWSKSGLVAKHGIMLVSGVIDSSYRGELMVVIENLTNQEYVFEAGDKVGQMLIQSFVRANLVEAAELSSTERGDARFGSSGK